MDFPIDNSNVLRWTEVNLTSMANCKHVYCLTEIFQKEKKAVFHHEFLKTEGQIPTNSFKKWNEL